MIVARTPLVSLDSLDRAGLLEACSNQLELIFPTSASNAGDLAVDPYRFTLR